MLKRLLGILIVLVTVAQVRIALAGDPTYYPNTVQATVDSTEQIVLSRDSLASVRAFFDKLRKTATVTDTTSQGERTVAYTVTISVQGGPRMPHSLLMISEHIPGAVDLLPLYHLKKLVGRYNHTQADYDAVMKKYGNLQRAYFREVDTDEGTKAEDVVIVDKHKVQILGPEPKDTVDSPEDEKRAEELEKKLAVLEAKGDLAGMVALSRKAQADAMKSPQGQGMLRQQEALNKDNWTAWVKCLDELKGVAYWTRIWYGSLFGGYR